MKENEIKNYYKKKIDELSKNNKLYFDKSAPKITDADYDQLKKEIFCAYYLNQANQKSY